MSKLNWNRVKVSNQLRNSEPAEDSKLFSYGYWPSGRSPYYTTTKYTDQDLERFKKLRRAKHVKALLALRQAKQP